MGVRRVPAQERRRDVQNHLACGALWICQGPPSTRQRSLVEGLSVARAGAGCSGQGPAVEGSASQLFRSSFKRLLVPLRFVREASGDSDRALAVHLPLCRECARPHHRVGDVSAQGQVREPVAVASVYLFRVVAQRLFPLVRELLRDHVLDRQAVAGRRLLPMLGFHQFAEDRKRGSGRAPSVGLPGSDALSGPPRLSALPTRVFRSR